MPMRWTPENDQLLLLKILETHDLSVDTKKVAAAWPTSDGKDKPTPRAITERLVKMRQLVRDKGEGNFSISAANSSSTTTTPRKSKKTATTTTACTPGSSAKKRKNAAIKDEDDIDLGTPSKIKSESVVAGTSLGITGNETVDYDDGESPSKRARKATTLSPGMVSGYGNGDDENGEGEDGDAYDSTGTEYVPDDSFDGGVKLESEMDVA